MKYILSLFMLTSLSCSSIPTIPTVEMSPDRAPAEAATCTEMIKRFFKDKPEKTLDQILVEKKLITFTEKKAQIHYPRLEWINRVKKSFNTSLRNWNNNRYPSFYLFNKEDIVPTAKKYAENLEKIHTNTDPIDDQTITKAFLDVNEWTKSYKNYASELDQLIEERISLQYNVSLLKKMKIKEGETTDVELIIKRNGILKKEIITLRKEDRNLKATINKLKSEMKDLDGSLLSKGRIKERIVRQAMLNDMLTILHREIEYVIKNSPAPGEEMIKELDGLSALLKQNELLPSTYGIYKIENKVFIREALTASKLEKVYAKIKNPVETLTSVLSNYFKNRNAGTDAEKIGFFKRMYAKITSITPKQAAIGGGTVVALGIGYERYFAISSSDTKEITEKNPTNEIGPDDIAHQEQLDETEKVDVEKHEGHSSVVEIHIDELTK